MRGAALAIAVHVFLLSSDSWADEVRSTSVCAIVAHPAQFEGHSVSLFSKVESGYHHTVLVDDSCPNAAISLQLPPHDKQSEEIKRLAKALFGPPKLVRGRFVGRLVVYPGDPVRPFEDLPALILELREVSELSIQKVR